MNKNSTQTNDLLQREPNRRKIYTNFWELHSEIFEELINTELSLVSTEQIHPDKSQNLKRNEYLKGKTKQRFEKIVERKKCRNQLKRSS